MLNSYQSELWQNLSALVADNEAFYHQDFSLDGKTYRIFNYRLASYTDFTMPGALECRGVMFEILTMKSGEGVVPLRLASCPMEKFFNLNENPFTQNIDLSSVVDIQEKADGSLISTYIHNGELRLKSKGSLFSEQALAAMDWLKKMPELHAALREMTELGFTVNLEWCAPQHRIVLGYETPSLKVLNIRNNKNGTYVDHWQRVATTLMMHAVESVKTDDPVEFVKNIPAMQNIEGFVLRLADGQRIKVKTEWYLSLHHAKDSVNNPRRLFEAILDEGIDDLRSLFHTDVVAIMMIDQMQAKVDHMYNSMVKEVESFYEENKDLDRKSYAIKGQKEVSPLYFSLVMNKYSGKSVDYKSFLKGKWKELGLKDEIINE